MSSTKKRLDVAFPLDTYEKIKAVAIETNQPVHHKSGEVMLTPVVLNLVNLGLERLAEEGLTCLARVEGELSDKQSDNGLNLSDIEQSLEKRLTQYLDKKIDKKIDELRSLLSSKQPIPHISPENPLPFPGTVEISSVATDLLQASEKLTAQAELPSPSEEVASLTPNLPASMTQSELARRLGRASDYLTRNRDKSDFREIDPEGIGWVVDKARTKVSSVIYTPVI